MNAMTQPPSEIREITANGLKFCVETRGNPEGEPVLFVMGLGAQMTLWPDAFLDRFVEAGYYVIRFDNRDIGLSTHLNDRLAGHPLSVMVRSRLGLAIEAPYTLHDMARDTLAIIEALELPWVHLVGASMGGMISQLVAAKYADRVRSLTLLMTSTNSPRLPMPKPELVMKMAGYGVQGHSEEAVVERVYQFWAAIQSPAYPTPEREVRERIRRDFHRAYHPAGILRQTRAILATGSVSSWTRKIDRPTAIIHGDADPLVRPSSAEQLKYLLPHARIDLIHGMAHDIPVPLWPRISNFAMSLMADASRDAAR